MQHKTKGLPSRAARICCTDRRCRLELCDSFCGRLAFIAKSRLGRSSASSVFQFQWFGHGSVNAYPFSSGQLPGYLEGQHARGKAETLESKVVTSIYNMVMS